MNTGIIEDHHRKVYGEQAEPCQYNRSRMIQDNIEMNKVTAPGAVYTHLKARSEGKRDMKLPHDYTG